MTPADFDAEEGFLFSSLFLYHLKYVQNNKIRSGSRNKQGNKQNPVNTFLGASQDDQDKRSATHVSTEPALSFAWTQM